MGNCCSSETIGPNLDLDHKTQSTIDNPKNPENQGMKKDYPKKRIGKKIDCFPDLPENIATARQKQLAQQPLKKPEQQGTALPPFFIHPFQGYYEGEWKKGIPHGKGKFYIPNKIYYQGAFNEGQPTGFDCLFIYFDGSYKRGNMRQGEMEGKGKFYYKINGLTYEGQWQQDKPHGQGIQKYQDGGYYKGKFVNGKKQDLNGFYRWSDGRTYEGEFKNGLMNGSGIMKIENSKSYCQGTFIKNEIEGEAIMHTQKGIYQGSFKNGKMEGMGKFKWYDGRTYQGQFKSGMLHGKGKLIMPDGQIAHGIWQYNTAKQLQFVYNDKLPNQF